MSAFRPTALLPPAHCRLLPDSLRLLTGGWRCPKCDNIIRGARQASARSPGNKGRSWGSCSGRSTPPAPGGLPRTPAPSATPYSGQAGPGHPLGSSGPEETPRRGSSLQPCPRTLGGPREAWEELGRGQEGRGGEGRQGGTQLPLLPAKRRWSRCPLPCALTLPPASLT